MLSSAQHSSAARATRNSLKITGFVGADASAAKGTEPLASDQLSSKRSQKSHRNASLDAGKQFGGEAIASATQQKLQKRDSMHTRQRSENTSIPSAS